MIRNYDDLATWVRNNNPSPNETTLDDCRWFCAWVDARNFRDGCMVSDLAELFMTGVKPYHEMTEADVTNWLEDVYLSSAERDDEAQSSLEADLDDHFRTP